MNALLEVKDVSVRFGGIVALDGVAFDIPKGQIVGLIEPHLLRLGLIDRTALQGSGIPLQRIAGIESWSC